MIIHKYKLTQVKVLELSKLMLKSVIIDPHVTIMSSYSMNLSETQQLFQFLKNNHQKQWNFKMTSYISFFKNSVKVLRILGIWIDGDNANLKNIVSIFYHLFVALISIVFQIIFFMDPVNLTIDNATLLTATMPMYISVLVRIINFVHKQKKLESAMIMIHDLVELDFWIARSSGVKLKRRSDQIINIAKVQIVMILSAWSFTTIVSLATLEIPSKMWLPYQNHFFSIILAILWQQSYIFMPVTAAYIIAIFPLVLINLTTGLTEELGERIEKIGLKFLKKKKKVRFKDLAGKILENVEEKPKRAKIQQDEAIKELKKCIDIQLKIREIVREVNEIFGKVIWSQGFLTIIILCTTTYAMTVASFETYLKKYKFYQNFSS